MKDLFNLIHGTEPMVNTVAFLFFTFFGMLFIKIWRYQRKKTILRDSGEQLKFSFKIWLNDNSIDFLAAWMLALIMYRFFPDALIFLRWVFPQLPVFADKMFYGVLLGLFFQRITHYFFNNLKAID